MSDREWSHVPNRRRDNRRQGPRQPYHQGPSRPRGPGPRNNGGQGSRHGHRPHSRPPGQINRNMVTTGKALTNFFELNVSKCKCVYQYTVSIERQDRTANDTPVPGGTFKDRSKSDPIDYNRKRLQSFLQNSLAKDIIVAYDGRATLYSLGRQLPNQVLNEARNVQDIETCSPVTTFVKMMISPIREGQQTGKSSQLTEISHSKGQPFLRALNLFFAEAAIQNSFLGFGSAFFHPTSSSVINFPDSNNFNQNGDVRSKANPGFYQSTRAINTKFYLNFVDNLTALWDFSRNQGMNTVETVPDNSISLASLLTRLRGQVLRGIQSDGAWWNETSRKLEGLQVRAIHNFRTYRIVRFNDDSDIIKFARDGGEISVRQYFHDQYGKSLQHASLPCVQVQPGHKTHIPIEMLVVLKDQRRGEYMDDEEKRAFIDRANKPPGQRKADIQQMLANLDPPLQDMCNNLNINLARHFLKVQVDILEAQSVEYGHGRTVNVRSGYWSSNRRYRFIVPKEMNDWVIINLDGAPGVQDFRRELVEAANVCGMSVDDVPVDIINCSRRQLMERLSAHRNRQIVIIRAREKLGPLYSQVKAMADLELSTVTQVSIMPRNNRRSRAPVDRKYFENLVMKINTKLGGVNFIPKPQPMGSGAGQRSGLDIPGDTMIVGLDVSHTVARGRGASVAAVVGSIDDNFMQYCGKVYLQKKGTEIVDSLGVLFKDLVDKRRKATGKSWPQTIIVFRDGVSEGQYDEVKTSEVKSLREIYRESGVQYSPNITFIVITKRHHSRFFQDEGDPACSQIFDSRSKNIIPGAVIQDPITLKRSQGVIDEFYLNSHEGMKGTNKPCRYSIIHDDNNIDSRVLQLFAYRLCHGFARCTKSVSMTNAAYYAHLLAYRGRMYVASGLLGTDENQEITEPFEVTGIPDNLFFV